MTILTPTYNRAYILKQAFDSLCRQTDTDFEWIVVDDGSTDGTEELVRSWLAEPLPFPLRYIKQKNGGKHRAVNQGVQQAAYDYVMILDSDDHLTDDAVEKVHAWTKTIEGQEDFAGVSGLKGWIDRPGAVGGTGNGQPYIDARNNERYRYHLNGDKAEVYKTAILKQFPFPEFEGENFLSEIAVWNTIAQAGYRLRWFNEIIYKCEYLEDGLTKSTPLTLQLKNFQGFAFVSKLRKETEPFPYNCFAVGQFIHVARKKGICRKEAQRMIQANAWQVLVGTLIRYANELKKKIRR